MEQDEVWITADRMPLKLEEMDPEHRRNTLAMLRRRATFLMRAYLYCEIEDIRERGAPQRPLDGTVEVYDSPEAWLERRPLVRALARLVRSDEAIDAEVVDERQELTAS